MTASGQQLAAIVVDLSEDRRNWEELSFDHLLKSTRILMSGLAHEIRNLCGAALVIHRNLRRVSGLEENEDFRALGTLIQGLEKISELELKPAPESSGAAVHLPEVLDELRVLIEAMCLEGNVELRWHTDSNVPLVWADRYGLLQVFLNLFKNSYRAMLDSEAKILQVSASVENDSVVVRFEDTGTGIQHPENLFRPFQPGAVSSGLGLYVSQAILKGFGAEVAYEPRPRGCCFAVVLPLAPAPETALHA
jgi:signal transduction histidine kinase